MCVPAEEESNRSPVKFSLSSDREGHDGDLDTEEDNIDGAPDGGDEGEDQEGGNGGHDHCYTC